MRRSLLLFAALTLPACGWFNAKEAPTKPEPKVEAKPADPAPTTPQGVAASTLRDRAKDILPALPAFALRGDARPSDAEIALGRTLYFDPRLSKNHDISCASCHDLAAGGVDGEATSPGHKGVRGDRNSPTTLNAALHTTQFWDGREPDVEAQAKGPILNPVEMAMPDAATVVAVLESIPGYAPLFAAAFPGDAKPITYDHLGQAIGAFERGLLTPSPYDAFIAGDDSALNPAQLAGLEVFLDTGCTACHNGPAIGGNSFQKLGAVVPYETADPGRKKVTGNDADDKMFKVASLRNVTRTGP